MNRIDRVVTRWRNLSRGQKRFVWLASITIGPIFPLAAAAAMWLPFFLHGEQWLSPIDFKLLLVVQFSITNIAFLVLNLKSRQASD